ncbi:MAG TPA: transporter [Saprospiraceae bacterium]|nr:transporter [Saprospiraceae bacterium]
MIKYYLLISIILSIANIRLIAQEIESIQADRPDQTETPFTVPKNHFQMEFGFSYEHINLNNEVYTNPTSLFKYGLSKHFELGLIAEIVNIKSTQKVSGLTPVTLRFKSNITEEKGILPKTTIIGYLTIPYLASEQLKQKYYAPAFKFAMQNTLSKDFSLGYNLGAEWDGESPEPTFLYSISLGYSISEKIGAFAELFGFAPQFSKSEHSFDCGLNYLCRPNLLFDISGGIRLTENAPLYFIGMGFSLRLKD